MSVVPDITAGTGTESDETPGWWWPVGLSQWEGAHERVVSVDGALFRVPGHLGVGRPLIYTTASGRMNTASRSSGISLSDLRRVRRNAGLVCDCSLWAAGSASVSRATAFRASCFVRCRLSRDISEASLRFHAPRISPPSEWPGPNRQ